MTTTDQRIDLLWPQVHTLTLLGQLASFTQVAQRLGLSKAAVSQRITELERAVGQPLVQRTTRSVRLTDAGRRLVEQTGEAFELIARSVVEARDQAAQPRGLVRITAPVALGRQHVAPHLEAFVRAHPDIRVELDLSDRLVTLAHEGFDLAVRHTSAPPENHVAWKLCASRALLVANRAYLKRQGTPKAPADLAAHACLTYLRPGPAVWQFERHAQAGEPQRESVVAQGPLRAGNSEVLRDAALAGLGIALLPDFSAAAALRAGKLREVLPDWRPVGFFGDAVYAMRPWSPGTPKAVQAVVAHLRAALAGGFGEASLQSSSDEPEGHHAAR
ncbi:MULTISPECIES: LysR family transcriptional regulator [unclassified Rhizobacter]|uniref:LysR family transcriptional regulator n=1 Tax=unclassified Rhizobacter TaxID=2640088 RepID=UPI0006F97468|nr:MULTISPECIES: LysR family transcriptional regulator [unclassified Rhizobacter]KQU78196.1 LysR family transcriptional regulator [Rhizobacter sp. Root29]KQW15942.1 LysR family transcriptional regulator [Rhizobacter sp. Root1238]KRB25060.1 LysR family transcriptional regulator [Rhizobacter sp. Root16D2]